MSVPTYTPKDGDPVTVTRTSPDGRTSRWTGTLSDCHNGGFTLTGTGPGGHAMSSAFASADVLFRCHGVVQQIAPVSKAAV